MKQDRIEEGRFTENARGLGTVTEQMVRERAREIAVISGRGRDNVLDSDYEQAKRELTGEERLMPEPTAEEQVPEDQRDFGNEGSSGGKTPAMPAPDEQTFAEKLVEEGVEDAEHQQMLEAERAALKRATGS